MNRFSGNITTKEKYIKIVSIIGILVFVVMVGLVLYFWKFGTTYIIKDKSNKLEVRMLYIAVSEDLPNLYDYNYPEWYLEQKNDKSDGNTNTECEIQYLKEGRYCEIDIGDVKYSLVDHQDLKSAISAFYGDFELRKGQEVIWERELTPISPGPRGVESVQIYNDSIVLDVFDSKTASDGRKAFSSSIIIVKDSEVYDVSAETEYDSAYSSFVIDDQLLFFATKGEDIYIVNYNVAEWKLSFEEISNAFCCELALYKIRKEGDTIVFYAKNSLDMWFLVGVKHL